MDPRRTTEPGPLAEPILADDARTWIGWAPQAVYAPGVSDKPPQTYIWHTVVLFLVLVTAMVVFLRHQWG